MMNTNTITTTKNDFPYIDNSPMTREELEELFEEVLCTVEKYPKRVRKVVKNKKINVEDFSSQR